MSAPSSPHKLTARLIIDPPRDAFTNMGLDEALFNHTAHSPFAATLRLYSWEPHALSLGRRQSLDEVIMAECRARGIDVVKRIGGGAAVYHGGEITYCFSCRLDMMPMPSALQWHSVFSLLLTSLGLVPDAPVDCSLPRYDNNTCFACAAEDEPTVNGMKFAGSARRKSKTVFLQHGSILLARQPDMIRQLVRGAEPDRSVGLRDLIPSVSNEQVRSAFVDAVGALFNLKLAPGDYTGGELREAAAFAETRRSVAG